MKEKTINVYQWLDIKNTIIKNMGITREIYSERNYTHIFFDYIFCGKMLNDTIIQADSSLFAEDVIAYILKKEGAEYRRLLTTVKEIWAKHEITHIEFSW